MNELECIPKVLVNDKNAEKIVGDDLWLFPPILGGEKFILNSNAKHIYQLCKDRKSIKQILDDFKNVYPDVDENILKNDILNTLKLFWTYQLISWDMNPFIKDFRINKDENVFVEKLVYDNFRCFINLSLPNKYRNPYVKKHAIENFSMVEKQILEGSIVGYILYINDLESLKILLRFDRYNAIADILLIDYIDDITTDIYEWLFVVLAKEITNLWNVKFDNISFSLPVYSNDYKQILKWSSENNFNDSGILINECNNRNIKLLNKIVDI